MESVELLGRLDISQWVLDAFRQFSFWGVYSLESEEMAGGRPTVMTDDVLRKLDEAFLMGCTDVEACLFADIGERTLYDYCDANPEFSQRKARLKTNPVLKARQVLLNAIVSEGDVNTAKWMVEKLDGKAKQAVDVGGGDKPVEIVFSWDDGE